MEPIRHVLASPIKTGETETKELVFPRRIKASDFRGLPAELDQNANMLLISRLTNTELHIIEEMDGFDYVKVGEILQLFLVSGPKIGR